MTATAARAGFFFEPRTGRDINLAADDGFDAFLPRFLVKIHRAVKHAVIRDRERRELQFVRALRELVQPARRIQERILRVQVQVDEIDVRHGRKILAASGTKSSVECRAAGERAAFQHWQRPCARLPSAP